MTSIRTAYLLRAITISLVIVVVGVGCGKKESYEGEESLRPGLEPPKHAERLFDRAKTLADALMRVYVDSDAGKQMSLRIPDGWKGDGPLWRPDDGKINHIRVQYFETGGPLTEFEKQKASDVHEVVRAEEGDEYYELIVNHSSLKATIYKRFILIPNSGQSFYLFECRIGYDANPDQLWDACKTAADSAEYLDVSSG